MKTTIRIIAAICAIAILSGCNNDKTNDIVGTWRVTSVTAIYGGTVQSATDENSNMFYEFKSDGTMIEYGSETRMAEYSYNDNLGILTYRYSGKTDYTSANIAFSGKDEFDWYEKTKYTEIKMHLKRK